MDKNYFKAKLLSYIGDTETTCLKESNAILAGGAIRSLFMNEEIKDLDIYFRNKEDLKRALDSFSLVSNTHIKAITSRSITFSPHRHKNVTYQFIYVGYYSTPSDIFKDFDFTVCMGAYDFKEEEFHFDENFFPDNTTKKCGINSGTRFPLISMFRLIKYKDKGYDFPQKQLLELAKAINKFDYNDEDVVKDQTQGFYEIVEYEKPITFETEDIDFIISDVVEYIEDDGVKYTKEGNLITESSFDKFRDKMRLVEFEPFYVYKNVCRDSDTTAHSYYMPHFKYVVGEVSDGGRNGLYVTRSFEDTKNSVYSGNDGSVVAKLKVLSIKDILSNGNVRRAEVVEFITRGE